MGLNEEHKQEAMDSKLNSEVVSKVLWDVILSHKNIQGGMIDIYQVLEDNMEYLSGEKLKAEPSFYQEIK